MEIHGLAGAIGEQLGLAWTAEQDVQRFVATREGRTPEHQRLMQRALAELGGHFVLGGTHSLTNFTLRVLLLNKPAAAHLCASYPKANGFAPGTAMESFFALLQKNVLDRRTWSTREELPIATVTWIERTYHRRRRQDGLGRLTPIEYETIMTTPATQAA